VNPIGAIAFNYSANKLIYVSDLENVDTERAQNISGDADQIIYIDFQFNTHGEFKMCLACTGFVNPWHFISVSCLWE
jgi:hypothetical protein